MPIPTPNENESQSDFTNRCHSALATEYDKEDQRHAICMESWQGAREGGEGSLSAVVGGVGVPTTRLQVMDSGFYAEQAERFKGMSLGEQVAEIAMFGEAKRCPDGTFMPKSGDCSGHTGGTGGEGGEEKGGPGEEAAIPSRGEFENQKAKEAARADIESVEGYFEELVEMYGLEEGASMDDLITEIEDAGDLIDFTEDVDWDAVDAEYAELVGGSKGDEPEQHEVEDKDREPIKTGRGPQEPSGASAEEEGEGGDEPEREPSESASESAPLTEDELGTLGLLESEYAPDLFDIFRDFDSTDALDVINTEGWSEQDIEEFAEAFDHESKNQRGEMMFDYLSERDLLEQYQALDEAYREAEQEDERQEAARQEPESVSGSTEEEAAYRGAVEDIGKDSMFDVMEMIGAGQSAEAVKDELIGIHGLEESVAELVTNRLFNWMGK